MGIMGPRNALWALAVCICLCNAQDVPIATNPILETVTSSTDVPQETTIFSIIPMVPPASLITSDVDGTETVITSFGEATNSFTSTIISTIYVPSQHVVVNTVGYTTIYGPDPAATTSQPPPPPPAETSSAPPPETSSAEATSSVIAATTSSTSSSASSSRVASSTRSSSSAHPSSTSTAIGASESETASSSSGGLSTGAKAGIGVGVVIIVIWLAILGLYLGCKYSRRRRGADADELDDSDPAETGEKDNFKAGQPYEMTGSDPSLPQPFAPNSTAYSTSTTELGKRPDVTGPYENSQYIDPAELPAVPRAQHADDPVYVGVPSHMSGSKRWSTREFER